MQVVTTDMFDHTVDVLVIGSGGGGMTAALAAFADAGLWTRDGEVLTSTAFGWEASVVVDGWFVDGDPGEGWGSPA